MAAATVVFCDIVGFSLLNNQGQVDAVFELNRVISNQLYSYLHNPHSAVAVVSLPTGDGVALAFLLQDSPPNLIEVGRAVFTLANGLMNWSRPPSIRQLRIGIHQGDVIQIIDINYHVNICGVTVNECQRVMNAAHPNQVLVSGAAFDRLVGPRLAKYSEDPFTKKSPASFDGPFPIVAKHGKVIDTYVMTRIGIDGWGSESPPHAGIIHGRVERTRFIVESLRALKKIKERLNICEQSALSSFAILPRNKWRNPNDCEEYLELVEEQRKLLEELIKRKTTTFQLLLYPNRLVYNPDRCEQLLKWLRDNETNPRVYYRVGGSGGPNRLIIRGKFCIEGYKNHDNSGYELSIVYSGNDIEKPQTSFDKAFAEGVEVREAKDANGAKVCAIKTIEGLCVSSPKEFARH